MCYAFSSFRINFGWLIVSQMNCPLASNPVRIPQKWRSLPSSPTCEFDIQKISHSHGNVVMYSLPGRPHFCVDCTRYFVGSGSFLECLWRECQWWFYTEISRVRNLSAKYSTSIMTLGLSYPESCGLLTFPNSVRLRRDRRDVTTNSTRSDRVQSSTNTPFSPSKLDHISSQVSPCGIWT